MPPIHIGEAPHSFIRRKAYPSTKVSNNLGARHGTMAQVVKRWEDLMVRTKFKSQCGQNVYQYKNKGTAYGMHFSKVNYDPRCIAFRKGSKHASKTKIKIKEIYLNSITKGLTFARPTPSPDAKNSSFSTVFTSPSHFKIS